MGLDFPLEEVPGVVERVRNARQAVGRHGEPFEIFLSPREEVQPDTYRRLEDMGVTAVLLPAWSLMGGDFGGLDAKRRQMEGFAREFF